MTTKVIYKYELEVEPSSVNDYFLGVAEMPENAKVISAGIQNGELMVWAEVEKGAVARTQTDFVIVPTGGEVKPGHTFLSTVFNGPFVWHVYWIRPS